MLAISGKMRRLIGSTKRLPVRPANPKGNVGFVKFPSALMFGMCSVTSTETRVVNAALTLKLLFSGGL